MPAPFRDLPKPRGISINKLMEELATISLAEFNDESRFRALAAQGSAEKGLVFWTRWMKPSRPQNDPPQIVRKCGSKIGFEEAAAAIGKSVTDLGRKP